MSKVRGVLGIEYHKGRESKKSWKYRLRRRTLEVIRAIKKHHPLRINSILDIGAADGLMLSRIKDEFPEASCIGLEYSKELIMSNQDKRICLIQADAQDLPFHSQKFDLTIATALIEHVPDPLKVLREICRVLVRGGYLVFTTPDPFWEHLATLIGHLGRGLHYKVMNLRELKEIVAEANFQVIETEKFMLSPVGMPFELAVEKVIKNLGLRCLLSNQIIIGRK